MHLIFCEFKKDKNFGLNFLQTLKDSKTINSIFASLKQLQKHAFHFLQAYKS